MNCWIFVFSGWLNQLHWAEERFTELYWILIAFIYSRNLKHFRGVHGPEVDQVDLANIKKQFPQPKLELSASVAIFCCICSSAG